MIILAIVAMALLGGTTWFSMNQSMASNPALNRRWGIAGLLACATVAVGVLAAEAVTLL
jgi:hypothetical protein